MFVFFPAACGPRSVPHGCDAVRFSEAGEVALARLSTDPAARLSARRADGDAPSDGARTRDCLPSQLGRTTGTRPGRTANLAAPARPAPHRSGRVSGVRPSDRRGPGPAGHRGRNVRSTGRCSYNLRITRRRADSCGLHRSTSQVIRRSGSGVCILYMSLREKKIFLRAPSPATRRSDADTAARRCAQSPTRRAARSRPRITIFRATLGRGVAARGRSASWSPSARGHGVGLGARETGA